MLIVTIVNKGWGDEVIKASRKAGAHGGTILFGRGTGIHENQSIFGLMIEPEKEIVLTIAKSGIEDDIRNSIIKAINLNEPGMGIGFVVSLDKVFGICHPLYEMKCSDKEI